jgi:hypothetical protein
MTPDRGPPWPMTGFGAELATGWQDSGYPVEGRAWSVGVEGRRRFTRSLGAVGRYDRSKGRDAGFDADGDGRDDVSTGAVTRHALLGGASLVLHDLSVGQVPTYVELDALVGQLWTSSHAGEDGVVAALDLSFQGPLLRTGVRVVRGLTSDDVTLALFHVGLNYGAWRPTRPRSRCTDGAETAALGTRLAVGLDIPLGGAAIGTGLGVMVPGFGIEAAYHLHQNLDALVRGDLLVFPNGDADRVLHQSVLAGGRIDLSAKGKGAGRVGTFLTVLGGYAFAAVTEPSRAGAGPIADVSLGYGIQEDVAAAWVRVHGRFGVVPDNRDLRAVLFLSVGMELRLDRRRWRDRD